MKWFLSLLLCLTACAQLPVIPYPVPSGSSRWWPTNATGGAAALAVWFETIPTSMNGTWGPDNLTHPAADNTRLKLMTNFASGTGWTINAAGSVWTADQTLFPTNFVSGGGANGLEPRMHWEEATAGTQRMTSGNIVPAEPFTVLFVCNCDNSSSGSAGGLYYNSTTMKLEFNSSKLQMNGASQITGPATIVQSQWYIITAIFNGASSRIDTNGVTYVSGNDGGGASATAMYLGQFQIFKGNISRIWGWNFALGSTDEANAVAQCKTDFGIQ